MMLYIHKMLPEIVLFLGLCLYGIYQAYSHRKNRQTKYRQNEFIQTYSFSTALTQRFQKDHSELSPDQVEMVFSTLKSYFQLCHKVKSQMVSMPSQIVDDAWHNFILFTRDYQDFCQKAFGQLLHHTPTEKLTDDREPSFDHQTLAQQGMKLAWRLACQQEGISIQNPDRLPLLFAIDEILGIKEGFYYSLNCLKQEERETPSDSPHVYSISDFISTSEGSCSQGCSSSSCCGNNCSAGSCSGSSCSGSSCGGSSCGGGCSSG